MRITYLFIGLFAMAAMGLVGCVQDGSRQQVADDLAKSESQVFPDQAVWMGDEGGYHYVRVRNIYSYKGDTDYRIPVEKWTLGNSFPLTDDASKWRNVQWQDSEIFRNSRFAYALVNTRQELFFPASTQTSRNQYSQPTTDTQPATTEPQTTLPAGPTTQPSTQQ